MKKQVITIAAAVVALFAFTGCESTAGYRKSAGGQSSNKTVKVNMKHVSFTGNVILDLDDGQSSVGDADQGGTAQAAASGNKVDPEAVTGAVEPVPETPPVVIPEKKLTLGE